MGVPDRSAIANVAHTRNKCYDYSYYCMSVEVVCSNGCFLPNEAITNIWGSHKMLFLRLPYKGASAEIQPSDRPNFIFVPIVISYLIRAFLEDLARIDPT